LKEDTVSKDESTYRIKFNDLSTAEAGVHAQKLLDVVLDAGESVSADLIKADPNTMDMGATIVLLLGAPAAVAVAKGIADYIRRAGVSITVTSDDKEVTIKNMDGEDVANSLKAIFSKK
jgi:hypothetical protein